jgi:hypothetical protein
MNVILIGNPISQTLNVATILKGLASFKIRCFSGRGLSFRVLMCYKALLHWDKLVGTNIWEEYTVTISVLTMEAVFSSETLLTIHPIRNKASYREERNMDLLLEFCSEFYSGDMNT